MEWAYVNITFKLRYSTQRARDPFKSGVLRCLYYHDKRVLVSEHDLNFKNAAAGFRNS